MDKVNTTNSKKNEIQDLPEKLGKKLNMGDSDNDDVQKDSTQFNNKLTFRDYINEMINGPSKDEIEKYIEEFSPVYKNSVSEANIELSNVSAGEFIAVFFKLQEALHQRLDSQKYKDGNKIFNEKKKIDIKMGETKLTIEPRNEYHPVRIMFGLIKRGNEKAKKYTDLYVDLNEYLKNTPEWEKKVLNLFLKFSSEGIPISTQDISVFENCRTDLPEIVDTLNELCFLAFFWEPMQWFDDSVDKLYEKVITFAKSIKLLENKKIDFEHIFSTDSEYGLFQTKPMIDFGKKEKVLNKADKIDKKYNDEIDSSRNTLNILEEVFGRINRRLKDEKTN